MKFRSRKYKYSNENMSYWPSFVDAMTSTTLVFFFIMLLSMGISIIFVDDIAAKRENVYEKIKTAIEENNLKGLEFNDETSSFDIPANILFDSNSAKLKETAKTFIEEQRRTFYSVLSDKEVYDAINYIEIIGHTDYAGTTIHGRNLSADRANAYLNNLVPMNSDIENEFGHKFKASGMSEFENFKTKAERDRNYVNKEAIKEAEKYRRIEIRIDFSDKDLEEALQRRLNGEEEKSKVE